ncbi:MAG: putative transposase [Paraglaciecola sp.]|jgi:transposase-like protein
MHILSVTNAVIDKVVEWQSRLLDPIYPIIYLDSLVVQIRQDKRVINKYIFLKLVINTGEQKELMGM